MCILAFVRCCPSTIHLNIFPTEANEIFSIFMEFTDNMHKQMWLIGKDIPTFELLEAKGAEITSLTFNASGMGVTWDEMPKVLSTRGFYLYAKVKGLEVDVPIDKVTKVIVSKPVYGEVRVKEQCFFPSYQVVYEKDQRPEQEPSAGQRAVCGFLLSFETTPFRGQPPTNVSTAYSRSFASEIRYFFLPYTKYVSEKLPFSSAKSLAECLPPIYAVLPETKKGPCIQSINDGRRGLGDNLYDQRNAVIFFREHKKAQPEHSFRLGFER